MDAEATFFDAYINSLPDEANVETAIMWEGPQLELQVLAAACASFGYCQSGVSSNHCR